MSKQRYTERQIIEALQQVEAGSVTIEQMCQRFRIHNRTFYKWRAKYEGLDANEAARLRQLEEENRRLKHAVADLTLDNQALRGVLAKKF